MNSANEVLRWIGSAPKQLLTHERRNAEIHYISSIHLTWSEEAHHSGASQDYEAYVGKVSNPGAEIHYFPP